MAEGKVITRQLRALVFGRVQGVNFRAYTSRKAHDLGLTGWVRNLSDGSVEAVAEGEQSALEAFLEYLCAGPSSASVSCVEAQWGEESGTFDYFQIKYTPF